MPGFWLRQYRLSLRVREVSRAAIPRAMRISAIAIALLVFVLIALFATTLSAQFLPVGQRESNLLYDRSEHLETRTFSRFDFQLGPYYDLDTTVSSGPFEQITHVINNGISAFGFVAEDARSARGSRGRSFTSFRAGIAGQPASRLLAYGDFRLDEQLAKDSLYRGKKWRGFAGNIEHAFASYRTDRFELTLGRFASFWGQRNSLVLGPDVVMDGLAYRLQWGRLTLSYRLAQLDGIVALSDSSSLFENRYFAAHRFDFHLSDRLRLGLYETVIFGGLGRQIELFYLNPLIFFHGSQLNSGVDDNTAVGFDFTFKPKSGIKLYGQLHIDDIQLDRRSKGDQEPNEYGLLIGYYQTEIAGLFDLRCEYSRVTNRTYHQPLARNRYLIRDRLISAALDTDYDFTSVQLMHWFGRLSAVTAQVTIRRQGEGSLLAPWSAPWETTAGTYTEKFPTGVVETTITPSLRFKGFIERHLFVDVAAGVERISNFQHRSNRDETIPFVEAYLSLFGALPINLD